MVKTKSQTLVINGKETEIVDETLEVIDLNGEKIYEEKICPKCKLSEELRGRNYVNVKRDDGKIFRVAIIKCLNCGKLFYILANKWR